MKSASATERLLACPQSERLPHTDTRNQWAQLGDARHVKRQRVVEAGGTPEGLPPDLLPFDVRCEVAFAYNVATGEAREITLDGHRKYPVLGPFWLFGTSDVVGTDSDTVVIVDWKGWERNTRARDNGQLHTLAVMACAALQKSRALVVLAYGEGDEITWVDRAYLEASQLAEHAAKLRDMYAAASKTLNPGRYCRYCPAFAHCPEQQAAAAVEVAHTNLIPGAQLWENMQRAKLYAKRASEVLYAKVLDGEVIHVGDRELRIVQGEGKRGVKDGNKAYEIAKAYLTPEQLEAAFKYDTTLGDLKKAKLPAGAFAEMETCGAIAKTAGKAELEAVPVKPSEIASYDVR